MKSTGKRKAESSVVKMQHSCDWMSLQPGDGGQRHAPSMEQGKQDSESASISKGTVNDDRPLMGLGQAKDARQPQATTGEFRGVKGGAEHLQGLGSDTAAIVLYLKAGCEASARGQLTGNLYLSVSWMVVMV